MTTRTPRPVLSLAQQIEGHQSRFAARPAAEYLGVTINYRELNALADRLAHVLRSLGLGRGDVLGIHLPNTPQYLVALIAASKLGAAISGVSPLLTPSEIVHQVNDARIKVLLTLDQLYNPAVTPIDGQVPGLKAVLVATPIDVLPGWKKTLAYALKKVPKVALKPMKSVRVLDYWREQKAASSAPVAASPRDTARSSYAGPSRSSYSRPWRTAKRRACCCAAPDSACARASAPCTAMKSRLCTRSNGCPRRTCSPSSTSTRVTTPANGTVTWVVVASGDIASAGSPVTGTSVAARLRSVLMPRLRSC